MEMDLQVSWHVGEHTDDKEHHQHVGQLTHHVRRIRQQRAETFREFCGMKIVLNCDIRYMIMNRIFNVKTLHIVCFFFKSMCLSFNPPTSWAGQ